MNNLETIYLGGGCFWCLEAVFQRVRGVEKVVSGYSGGNKENPSYEEVSSGETGHAEVVEISFDRSVVSLEIVLDIFFDIHDPTSLNKQGNDVGTQYRSIILVTSPEQLSVCFQKISELNNSGKYNLPIVTELKKYDKFYPAENYHQNFYINNQNYPYCSVVIDPKLKKFMEHFSQNLKF